MAHNVYLDNEEFSNRLHDKIMTCTPSTLTRYLLDFAYEEISEEFNNEIITEWESEQNAKQYRYALPGDPDDDEEAYA